MDSPRNTAINMARPVQLDQYDSVRDHVWLRLNDEVVRLERRLETLRDTQAPHASIIIATYERMIDRKKGFMKRWGMGSGQG
ncbi:hypothetical protein [Marinobacter sp.]|uniref:hypothetical protein n=1 Tax=Marinobacter sp. TaxID=50741 RepID=UPI003850F569